MREWFFPFDRIKKGSRVVLYGAGENGRALWQINEETGWCRIVACVDRNYRNIFDFPYAVSEPCKTLAKVDYEYVLVSVVYGPVRHAIADSLIGIGVPQEKIVDTFLYSERRVVSFKNGGGLAPLRIGFRPRGVIGDCIISLKMYQELVHLAAGRCQVDVLDDWDRHFLGSVFHGQKCMRGIERGYGTLTEEKIKSYDLVVDVRFEPYVIGCDMARIGELAPELAGSIRMLLKYQRDDYPDLPDYQYANRILLDRARFLGLNRYTLFNISGAFGIKDSKVDFYLDGNYEDGFIGLNLPRPYVTYNFGANNQFNEGRRQTKMWPYEYHVELNRMLKESYPGVGLVQLGSEHMEKVPGADRYVLGESLEVVKYVLKNALFHFDCEGGLVHMATQLGTKCFVVFGPTPGWFLGYIQNENILPEVCGECKGLIKDWYTRCYKYGRPECMYSIKPGRVFALMERYLCEYGIDRQKN